MRRLKELDAPASPIEADAVDLLRTAPGYEPSAGQKQRVRARLLQIRVTPHRTVSRAAIVAVVILCAAVASAAVGRRWIAETIQVLAFPSAGKIPSARATGEPVGLDQTETDGANGIDVIEGREGRDDMGETAVVTDRAELPRRDRPTVEGTRSAGAVGDTTDSRRKRVRTGPQQRSRASGRDGHGRKLASAGVVTGGHAATAPPPRTQAAPISAPSPVRQPLVVPDALDADAATAAAQTAAARVASADAAAGAAGYAAGRAAGPREGEGVTRATRPTSQRARAAAPLPDDTGLVFDAMRALRQDRRPARASRLLGEYLRRHPDGTLSEEALALSVEAAGMRGDARTPELIRMYLERYPSGHFRTAVELTRARLR